MAGFRHEAIFYRDDDEYLAGTLPDVRDALAADGAVLVAVSDSKQHLLRQALNGDADRVRFTDMERLGRNPACIIPAWREFLRDADSAGPVVGIGEPVWPGRSDAELVECGRHESLLNLAFDDGRPWKLLCPYDAGGLDAAVLDDACRNHPRLGRGGERWASDRYSGPRAVMVREDTLAAPGRGTVELSFAQDDLVLVRQFVTATASRAGFGRSRLADLVLAVNELTTNTLRHAGGHGLLRMWTEGDRFLCEVSDAGHIDDPLVGRVRPSDLRDSGRGLWMVNQLCDLVQLRSSKAGNVVRLHMSLA